MPTHHLILEQIARNFRSCRLQVSPQTAANQIFLNGSQSISMLSALNAGFCSRFARLCSNSRDSSAHSIPYTELSEFFQIALTIDKSCSTHLTGFSILLYFEPPQKYRFICLYSLNLIPFTCLFQDSRDDPTVWYQSKVGVKACQCYLK